MIPLVLLLASVLLIRVAVKSRGDYVASLVLFFVACSVKVAFLLWWANYKQGEFNLEYLQFPDEYFYVRYTWCDPLPMFGKAYCVIIYVFQCLGFSYFDLKLLNIIATSFALVRLYSLSDLVADKAKYYWLLLYLGGILHIHVIYYSVFILKDGLIFLFSMELFVQLIRRKSSQNTRSIMAVIFVLAQLRWTLAYLLGLFLFDRQWKSGKGRMLVLACVLLAFLPVVYEHSEAVILQRFSVGLRYSADINYGERVMKDEAREVLRGNPKLVATLALINAKNVLSPFHQKEIISLLILLQFYASMLYLLSLNRTSVWTLWPVLLFPLALLGVIILTSATIRWAMYPFSTLIYAFIFLACHPQPDIVRCGSRCLGAGPARRGASSAARPRQFRGSARSRGLGTRADLSSLGSFETLRPESRRR